MKLLFLDLETTGLDHNRCGILQIYAEYHENGECIKNINLKCVVDKDVDVNLGALAINRISMKGLRNNMTGELESTILEKFCDFILEIPNDKSNPVIVAGHNVSFDINFINSRLKKLLKVDGIGGVLSYRVQDTSTIGEFFRKAGVISLSRMSLENLGKSLGLNFDKKNLHDAKADVKLTAECYYKMLNMLKELKGWPEQN